MSDRLLRFGTAAAVLLVALIAAIISFIHIQHLALTHGQATIAADLLPLSIDGAVTASSLVLLRAARAQIPAPVLAQFMLGLSVVATLAANVAYGAVFGVTGALVSGWPAVAFIGCAEMAITMARRASKPTESNATEANWPQSSGAVPSDVIAAAETWYRATVAVGNPASLNRLQERFSLTRAEATTVRESVAVESNGHAPAVAA